MSGLASTPVGDLFDPELDDAADQIKGYRCVERKLHRAFPALVGLEFLLERLQPARRRIEANVVLEGREVHQVTPGAEV